jgi:hypothetical protein
MVGEMELWVNIIKCLHKVFWKNLIFRFLHVIIVVKTQYNGSKKACVEHY